MDKIKKNFAKNFQQSFFKMSSRKIMKELKGLEDDPLEGVTVETVGQNVFQWKARIHGPPGTEYEGGVFILNINFPTDYPLRAPKCKFETKIYHPNIGPNGEICLNILGQNWKPIETIRNVLQNIYYLFETPEPEGALSAEIGAQYKNDLAAFKKTAAEWTKLYATEQ